jgi:hypothetical protein
LLHWRSALKVLGGGLDVEVNFLLAQINHVAGKERLAMLLKVLLISLQKTIQPWKELLGAVVSVQNDGNAVRRRDGANILGSCDTSGNGSLLATVGNTLLNPSEIAYAVVASFV